MLRGERVAGRLKGPRMKPGVVSWPPVRGVLRLAIACGVVAACALANAAGAFGFSQVPGSPFALGSVSPIALAFSPSGGLLVTSNMTPDTEVSTVSVFTVAAGGALTQTAGSPFSTGSDPGSVAFSPSGGLVAFANPSTPDGGGNTVSVFSVSAGGVLTEVPGSPFGTGSNPESVAFSPSGKLLATANYSAGSISVFSVGAGGVLTEVPGSPFIVGSLPESVAFSPNGALLAIQSFNSKSVSVFSVGAGGALTQVPGSPFGLGSLSGSIAFSPNGELLAVAPSSASLAGVTPNNSVTIFSVGAAGALTQVPGSPFRTGGMETTTVAFTRSGTLLATNNYGSGNISLLAVAPSGALTQVPGSPFGTGFGATSLAINPSGMLLATANIDYSGVSVFSIGSYGQATRPTTTTTPTTSTTPTTPSTPTTSAISSTQIRSALRAIAHPSGKKTINALVRTGVFKTHFDAPVGGSLTVIWKTIVTAGKGKHKKRRIITIARGFADVNSATTITVTLHLTEAGKALLKKRTSGLSTTATEKFRPYEQTLHSVTTKFAL